MDDSWYHISTRHQSRTDLQYGGEDDMDDEDEVRPEFLCPFCAEDFDVVELCCHIDEEHSVEAKNGVCPVCAKRVGMDLVDHITIQHASLLKVQRKKRLRKGGSNLKFSRKDLHDEKLQSFLGGSQSLVSSNADPLLSSFVSTTPTIDEPLKEKLSSLVEASLVKEFSAPESFDRKKQQSSPLSAEDQKEGARRSEFVQGLLLSTFMDENF